MKTPTELRPPPTPWAMLVCGLLITAGLGLTVQCCLGHREEPMAGGLFGGGLMLAGSLGLVFVSRQQLRLARAEQRAQALDERLRLAIAGAGIGIWELDLASNEMTWDEMMHRLYEVPVGPPSEVPEKWEKRVHPEDRFEMTTASMNALEGKGDLNYTFRIRMPDGGIRFLHTQGQVVKGPDGKALRMLGTNRDVTHTVKAEAALHESEERFRHAFEYSAFGMALVAPDGAWLTVNMALCRMLDYTEEELSRQKFQDITHPDDLAADLANVNKLVAGDIPFFQMEKRYLRKDGSTVWATLTASVVRAADGTPAYFVSQVEDITQRHEAERVLKHQQNQLRTFIEHTPAAVAMFDRDMRYLAASRRWLEDYHLDSQSLIGRCHYDVFPEIGEDWKAVHARALAGNVEGREEDMFVRMDGHEEWLRWEVRPWTEADGSTGGIVMFTEVVTGRKKAAEEIQASLEEKEVLLREIHHRVKNNMQIISSLLQLQTSALRDPVDVEIFKDCQARIRAMALVHDRLYRSKNLSTIRFAEHLDELAHLVARGQESQTSHITLALECEDVELDLDKAIPLGLIATELISNAYKHAFQGREKGHVSVSLKQSPGGEMCLSVSDDGRGMPPETGSAEAGRTLGLRLVRSLARQMRAEILFVRRDMGCCVEIHFHV